MTQETVQIRLEPLSVVAEVARGSALLSTLSAHGMEFPCGGIGTCGGCRVRVLLGSLGVTEEDEASFSAEELRNGWRLACQARAVVPLALECSQWEMDVVTDNSGLMTVGRPGLGIAVDVGTTTIAAQMIDMATGVVQAVETGLNPQASFGSDVMSRVQAALGGADLTTAVRLTMQQMIAKLAGRREQEIREVILVGNTVMHHLFCSLDVGSLSHAPFESPHLETRWFMPKELGWELPGECKIRFERCLGGFVGSDILAGIVAVGMPCSEGMMALLDLGTNGEIAIGNRSGIMCASTAAGPAFEAGSIHMGMRAATGAISRVRRVNGATCVTVIGDGEPRGICGSGLVDAVATGLVSGRILTSGRIASSTKLFPVADPVVLRQADIRELQLAKGAIASGFRLLLKRLGMRAVDLESIYLAGAFGNYVQIESAIVIGLIEAPRELIHAAGNTALRGAKVLLVSAEEPGLPRMEHVNLAVDPGFQDEYATCMRFPEVAWTS